MPSKQAAETDSRRHFCATSEATILILTSMPNDKSLSRDFMFQWYLTRDKYSIFNFKTTPNLASFTSNNASYDA